MSTRIVTGKNTIYKFFYAGNNAGTGGVDILVAEKWIEKVIDVNRVNERIIVIKVINVNRVNDRIIVIKLVVGQNVLFQFVWLRR